MFDKQPQDGGESENPQDSLKQRLRHLPRQSSADPMGRAAYLGVWETMMLPASRGYYFLGAS